MGHCCAVRIYPSWVIHAFVTSRLDYHNALFHGIPQKLMFRLTKIQNTAVRIITLCKSQDNETPYLKTLHWLPVPLRIKIQIVTLQTNFVNWEAKGGNCHNQLY
jgi:hypothetical protein